MNLFAWAGLLTLVTCIALVILIAACSTHPMPPLNRLMVVFNVFVGLWGLGTLLVGLAHTPETGLWAWRVAYLGPPMLGMTFYHLSRILCEIPGPRPVRRAYAFGIAFALLSVLGLALRETQWLFNLHYIKANPLLLTLLGIWIWIVVLGHRHLFIGYRTSEGLRRKHLKFIFYAMAIGFLGGTSSVLPALGLHWYPIGNFTIPFYSLIITYAILRHHLLDVRIALTRTGVMLATYLFVLGGPIALSLWGRIWLHTLLGEYWWAVPMGLSTMLATAGPFIYAYLRRQAEQVLLRQLAQREVEASTDALTGVLQRRAFLERAAQSLAQCLQLQRPLALLMIDLDHFKEKNDSYGHAVGDLVLREAAKRLGTTLRAGDLLGRYGGEEFVITLPFATQAQALEVAERLRRQIGASPIQVDGHALTQTLSIGVASAPADATALEALIIRADQALYAAKHAGRDRIKVAA